MRNASPGGGSHCRRHCGREDEAWRGRADRVADYCIGRDVTAHDAKTFGQCPFDDVDAVHDAIALGDAGTAGAVKADRVLHVKMLELPEFLHDVPDLSAE